MEKRGVGYVAQGFSLYPHLSVWLQLLFAKGATLQLVAYWLLHLYLDGVEDRLPVELSGGQCQRVGLAQVLCSAPRVFLLDEPFYALDVPVRDELRRELRRLQRETSLATVLVTHDPSEAAFLSDELIVITNGAVLQSGPSRSVFSRPVSPEGARLVGVENLHVGRVATPHTLDVGGVAVPIRTTDLEPVALVLWSIRPEQVLVSTVARDVNDQTRKALDRKVNDVADTGTAYDLFIDVGDGFELRARTWGPLDVIVGECCRLELTSEAISLWPAPEADELRKHSSRHART